MPLTKKLNARFWLVQVSALVFILLFVSLGVWQLSRGNVKSHIEDSISDTSEMYESLSFPITDLEGARYKKVKLYGKYDANKQFLLDNQVRDRVVGYNVLTPFYIIQEKRWMLVDRGWIPQAGSRADLPDINFSNNDLQISGSIYVPYDKAYSLGGIADGEDEGWPRRIQFVEYDQIGDRLGISIEQFTLRLGAGEKHGYKRDWQAAMLSSNKHYGYSFQWFAMAFAIVVLWWIYSIKPLIK